MPTTGRAQKPWEGHRWVMHAMRVQAVVVVETLDSTAASASGQASVGACEGGPTRAVHVHVHVFAAAAVVILVCRCRSCVGSASGGDERRNGRARVCQRRMARRMGTYW